MAKKKQSALEKARSAVKKADSAHTPTSIKRKLKLKERKA
jgi:hypothetical protein